jgi:hypothetical protein
MEVNLCIRGSIQDPSVHSFIVASLPLPLLWDHDLNLSLVGQLAVWLPTFFVAWLPTFIAAWLPTFFIVASLPIPHSCGIVLLAKQYETNLSKCGIIADLSLRRRCHRIVAHATSSMRLHCRLLIVVASSPTYPCGILKDCGIIANLYFILLTIIAQLWHHCRLVLYCSSLSSCGVIAGIYYTAHHWAVAASSPTCG